MSSREDLDALQAAKLESETKKLHREIDALERELSPTNGWQNALKALSSNQGLLTVLVAVVGLNLSVFQWAQEQDQKRSAIIDDQTTEAMASLSSADAGERTAALALLAALYDEKTSTLTNSIPQFIVGALQSEKDPVVRSSMINFFGNLSLGDVSTEPLDGLMKAVVAASRGLVRTGNLKHTRKRAYDETRLPHEIEARASDLGHIIVHLLRIGAATKDLSGIYCVSCDFASLAPSISLAGMNFDDAILYRADFSGLVLVHSSFNRADIENTRFVEAELRHSRFTHYPDLGPATDETSYIQRLLQRSPNTRIEITGPDFSCADLAYASFYGHSLFGLASPNALTWPLSRDRHSSANNSLVVTQTRFVGANLKGADFSEIRVYGARATSEKFPFEVVNGFYRESYTTQRFDVEIRSSWLGSTRTDLIPYDSDLRWISDNLAGALWSEAKFPVPLSQFLNGYPPEKHYVQHDFLLNEPTCDQHWLTGE